jgi:putative acetyltransferase
LVDDLRRGGELVISLIAEEAGEICGHVALSRLKSPQQALALAPVSVSTTMQGRGIGTRLVEQALELARERGAEIVFVVGEPDYYARFGFSSALAAKFLSRYSGPYFMALYLTDARSGPWDVVYASAFDRLE